MTTEARSPEDELAEQPAIEWLEEVGWGYAYGPRAGRAVTGIRAAYCQGQGSPQSGRV